MGLEKSIPEKWFVRTVENPNGDVEVRVLRRSEGNYGNEFFCNQVIRVTAENKWWMRKFEDRLSGAILKAKKSAWQLNQRVSLTRQLIYKLENPNG